MSYIWTYFYISILYLHISTYIMFVILHAVICHMTYIIYGYRYNRYNTERYIDIDTMSISMLVHVNIQNLIYKCNIYSFISLTWLCFYEISMVQQ